MVKTCVSQRKTSTLGYFWEVGAIKNVNHLFLKIVKFWRALKSLIFHQFSRMFAHFVCMAGVMEQQAPNVLPCELAPAIIVTC